MSEMIERAARALAQTRVYEGYNTETKSRMIEREMDRARYDVRFVIKAMREQVDADGNLMGIGFYPDEWMDIPR